MIRRQTGTQREKEVKSEAERQEQTDGINSAALDTGGCDIKHGAVSKILLNMREAPAETL